MAKPESITVNFTQQNHAMVVSVAGEIDFSRSPLLRSKIIDALGKGCPHLVVDLASVPYMDSSGVATLVEALQVQRRKGHKLVLCGLQPKVRGIFEIARLDMVFTIKTDVPEAINT